MTTLDVDQEVQQTEAEAKAAKRAEQWGLVLPAMDRALQWVKDHQEHLSHFRFSIDPSLKYGVTVNLGLRGSDSDHAQHLKEMFAGKQVQKTSKEGDCQDRYQIDDDNLQIRFRWEIFNFSASEPEPRMVVETITL